MASIERLAQRGKRRGISQLHALGEELRARRHELGVSQLGVAHAAGLSRPRYTRVEAGAAPSLTVLELASIGSVLGLDSVVRLYPGGVGLRDAGHARRLREIAGWVRRPLTFRIEVALPSSEHPEQRAWDAMITGAGERTAIELETRIRDAQAVRRRHEGKRRDDPTEHFLLVVAATRTNRRVLAEYEALFADLPGLRPSVVRTALQSGRHPPTGLMLL